MHLFEHSSATSLHRVGSGSSRGFTLTELLVAVTIVLALASMTAAAISAAGGQGKKVRTRALIAKIDSIIASQYESYAGRNVDAATGAARGAMLRDIARGDLPDTWSVIADLAAKPESELTAHQRAYVAVWNSLDAQARQGVALLNSGAECLFLAVMHGGLSGCLDCGSLRIDVGDVDGDGMPEFLDAWGTPIGFVLWPSRVQVPPASGRNFFSAALPFDPVVVTKLDAKGGVMRPLVISAGPDGGFGLQSDAGPTPGSTESRDNLTNFDEEARG